MTKRKINVLDYSSEILKALSKGILLTVKSDKKVNTMAISWGALGIEWNKLLFTNPLSKSLQIALETPPRAKLILIFFSTI